MSAPVGSPPSRAVLREGHGAPPSWVLLTSLVLTLGVSAWTTWLHAVLASGGAASGSLTGHWLADSAIALPAVTVAVRVAVVLGRWVEAGARTRRSALLLAAVATSAISAAVTALRDATAGVPLDAGTAGRDALTALAVAVPLALTYDAAYDAAGPALTSARRACSAERLRGLAARAVAASMMLTGLALVPGVASTAAAASDPGNPCPTTLSADHQRTFDVMALDVKIPLNRYGDNDPQGKMYLATAVDGQPNSMLVPGETTMRTALAAVRAEESSQKVSIGLRDDPIQPLSIRANEGDCVTISFNNQASGGSFGMHIDGLAFDKGSSGDNIGTNGSSATGTGSSSTYRFWIPNDRRLEGSHYVHPGPGYRFAVDHGLFGTLTVEPPGSTYLDASTADRPLLSGWEAIIA
ncbi:MAG: multicopper oxidase domain-containing protein, partial [Actinomycetota bacterium]